MDLKIFFMGDYVVKFVDAEVLRLADKAGQTIGFINAAATGSCGTAETAPHRKDLRESETLMLP
jgi:hypothetical protein